MPGERIGVGQSRSDVGPRGRVRRATDDRSAEADQHKHDGDDNAEAGLVSAAFLILHIYHFNFVYISFLIAYNCFLSFLACVAGGLRVKVV